MTPRLANAAARFNLTPQQARVLAVLTEGLSNRGIAATLGISVRTVECHLDAIYDKLAVGTRAAAIVVVLEA